MDMTKSVIYDNGTGRKYSLGNLFDKRSYSSEEGLLTIGRDRESDITVGLLNESDETGKNIRTQDSDLREKLKKVSRTHGRFFRDVEGNVYFGDQSLHGTIVSGKDGKNSKELRGQSHVLSDGDTLSLPEYSVTYRKEPVKLS